MSQRVRDRMLFIVFQIFTDIWQWALSAKYLRILSCSCELRFQPLSKSQSNDILGVCFHKLHTGIVWHQYFLHLSCVVITIIALSVTDAPCMFFLSLCYSRTRRCYRTTSCSQWRHGFLPTCRPPSQTGSSATAWRPPRRGPWEDRCQSLPPRQLHPFPSPLQTVWPGPTQTPVWQAGKSTIWGRYPRPIKRINIRPSTTTRWASFEPLI